MANYQQTTPTNLAQLGKSIQIQVSGRSAFARFQRMYRNDRVAFAFDCFPDYRKTITDYQMDILGLYDEGHTRVAVRGPHGLGKTFLASVLIHHAVLTAEEDCKVPTTASAWRQLEKYLWPEIYKQSKKLDWNVVGRAPYDPREELLRLSIRLNEGIVEAFAVASDDHNTIEGAHASQLFYILDEAKTIPRQTWNAIEGAFSSEGILVAGKVVERDVIFEELKEQPGLVVYRDQSIDEPTLEVVDFGEEDGFWYNKDEEDVATYRDEVDYGGYTELGIESGNIGDNRVGIEGGNNGGGNRVNRIMVDRVDGVSRVGVDRSDLTAPPPHNQHTPYPHKERLGSGATRTIVDTSQSIISKALALAISTPGEPNGQFYDIHARVPGYEDWTVRHVTLEEAIRAGRIGARWAEQRAKQWGVDSSIYQNRVLGEFADTTEEGVIPLSWIRAAMDRWKQWNVTKPHVPGKRTLGCDVARGGVDKTVLCARDGMVVRSLHVFSKLATTSTARRIQKLYDGRKIHIEMDGGLGAAVYDTLKDWDVTGLVPITVGAKTTWTDKSNVMHFENVRAAMWWNMRELLDPDNGYGVCLPPIEELKTDLSTPMWEERSDGKTTMIRLESKKSIASRIGRSTDYGDACCLAFWERSSGGGVVL